MRLPRIRLTIGRLMTLVLVAGLTLWYALIVRPRLFAEHRIVEQKAEANYKQAKLIREVAEYAVKEYAEGVYKQDRATYLGQIARAKADLGRAMDRLKWSTEVKEKESLSRPFLIHPYLGADSLAKQQADFDLEQAQMQLKVFEEYTKEKQIKSLQSDVEKAKADEAAKFEAYRIEKARLWWLGF